MIIKFKGNEPIVDESALVFETSTIIGKTKIGKNVSVWPGACLRGDSDSINVGDGSNVQDNATVHTTEGCPVNIGKGVTVGHNAIIHGCTIKDNVLVGMGATVLDGAVIEENCIIGAGALVSSGKVIPAGSLVVGLPGKIVRQLTDDEVKSIHENALEYEQLVSEYKNF